MNKTVITTQKGELRNRIKQRKLALTATEKTEASERVCHFLSESTLFKEAQTVLLYHALPDELSIHKLLHQWWQKKCLLLPVVVGMELELRRYDPNHLQVGAFGIEEPQGDAFTDFSKIDVAFIPGISFDKAGNRLGRGKGFYDRLLPQITAPLVGICYDCQRESELPVEAHDRRMDGVLSETGWFIVNPQIKLWHY